MFCRVAVKEHTCTGVGVLPAGALVVVVALLVVVVPGGVVAAPAATQTSYPGKRWSQVDVPTAGFQLRKLASVMPFARVMRSHVSNLCHHILSASNVQYSTFTDGITYVDTCQ